MSNQEIRLVLSGDSTGLDAASQRGSRSLINMVSAANQAQTSLDRAGQQAGRTAGQMGRLGPQINDIAVSLQGGQQPLTVFLQQGSQIVDVYGGVGPALRAVGGLFTVVNVAAVAAGVGIGGYIMALMEGREQSQAFINMNTLTGGALGMTEGAFTALTQRVAESTVSTVGSAREIALALANTGRVGGESLEGMASAVLRWQAVSGRSSEEIVRDMSEMSRGVGDWAAKHNESMHFMTSAQLDYVRQLEDTGRITDAVGVVLDRMNERMNRQASLWERIKSTFSEAYDAAAGQGRADNTSGQLSLMQNRLYNARNGGGTAEDIAALEGGVRRLNMQLLRETESASADKATARAEQESITRKARLRAVIDDLSGANSEYAKTLRAIQSSAAANEITEERRTQLLTQTAIKFGSSVGTGSKESKKDKPAYSDPLGSFIDDQVNAQNRRDDARIQQNRRALEQLNDQSAQYGSQLAYEVARINADLIADDRTRGLAQIEIERQTAQDRIDVMKAGGADVESAQRGLNELVLARQAQLTESLKPQWRRMLDEWSNTNMQMAEAYDGMHADILQTGQESWTQLITTGQISAKTMVNGILAELARLQYQQQIAPGLSSILTNIVGAITGSMTVDTGGIGITGAGNSLASYGLGALDGPRADGGPTRANGLYKIAERGEPEVYQTRRGTYLLAGSDSGTVTPVRTSAAGASSGGGRAVVTVNNYGDNSVETNTSTGPNGEQMIELIIKRVEQRQMADLAGGGKMSRLFGNTFGLSRKTLARS